MSSDMGFFVAVWVSVNFMVDRVVSRWAGVSSLTLLSAMLVPVQGVQAHGYLNEPPSRAYQCQKGLNTNCGGAQYEPQSVGETFKGFPAGAGGAEGQGPVDGKIASGGIALFSAMDAQSATRWYKTEIKDRNITFDWKYTAAHPATKHEYFITRNGWNPNEPLKRRSFDTTPFCTKEGGNVLPVIRDEDGSIAPVKGQNNLFAQKESGVIRYELALDMREDEQARMSLSTLASEYVLAKGRNTMRFAMIANRDMNVEATLFNASNKPVGSVKTLAQGTSNWLEMDVRSEPGTHHMTLVGTTVVAEPPARIRRRSI